MKLEALIAATQKIPGNPGYAGAASDCLLEVAEPENAAEWLKVAHVFAMLAVADAITTQGAEIDQVLRQGGLA